MFFFNFINFPRRIPVLYNSILLSLIFAFGFDLIFFFRQSESSNMYSKQSFICAIIKNGIRLIV